MHDKPTKTHVTLIAAIAPVAASKQQQYKVEQQQQQQKQ